MLRGNVGRSERAPVSLLQASCWLALILVITKAVPLGLGWNLARRFFVLAMASWTDVLFALVCGVIAEATVRAVDRWPVVATALRALFLGLFALFAAYGVAAIGLYRYFNRPLTFQVLGLIGNATAARSSVFARITPGIGVALALVPLAFIAISLVTRRSSRAITATVVWVIAGAVLHIAFWKKTENTPLSLNPHFELLRTSALAVVGKRPAFPKEFPPEYVDEFRTIGARGKPDFSFFQTPPGVARPKNVVIIVLESVGTKYLKLYGSSLDVMPNLEAEAQHALVFDNIYAHASFTYCSFRTLNFSVYPGLPWHYALLPADRPAPATLASKLRERGVRTAYINNGDLDWSDERYLLEQSQAFATIDDYANVGCPTLTSWGTQDACVFDTLIRWIDEEPGEPFFAICWTDQTHDPYPLSPGVTPIDFFNGNPPPRYAKDLAAYLNVLHETDRHLGRMFAALRERGLADDTLVVVTGDHGEAFADPHDQRAHAWSVFDEEVKVPLLLWNSSLFPNGGRAETIGGHVDLNPTLADLLGIAPDSGWQGQSLFDPAKPNRAYFMAIAGGDVFGVREADWKYIYDVTSGSESLFNLRDDPNEVRNVVSGQPDRAKQLRERAAAWVTFEDAFLWSREN
ncbi:MAG: sulfatase-like hydrolase/transferase [Chthoniobacterales bacterium]